MDGTASTAASPPLTGGNAALPIVPAAAAESPPSLGTGQA